MRVRRVKSQLIAYYRPRNSTAEVKRSAIVPDLWLHPAYLHHIHQSIRPTTIDIPTTTTGSAHLPRQEAREQSRSERWRAGRSHDIRGHPAASAPLPAAHHYSHGAVRRVPGPAQALWGDRHPVRGACGSAWIDRCIDGAPPRSAYHPMAHHHRHHIQSQSSRTNPTDRRIRTCFSKRRPSPQRTTRGVWGSGSTR